MAETDASEAVSAAIDVPYVPEASRAAVLPRTAAAAWQSAEGE